jgi:hypothetical protein
MPREPTGLIKFSVSTFVPVKKITWHTGIIVFPVVNGLSSCALRTYCFFMGAILVIPLAAIFENY